MTPVFDKFVLGPICPGPICLGTHLSGTHLSEDPFVWDWPDRVGTGPGFSAGLDRSHIVMSRDCQLKYALP